MNSRHPETPARGWGGSEPQLLTPFPGNPLESRGSAGEFLTPDSVRSLFKKSALGGLAWTPTSKRPMVFHVFLLQPSKNLRKIKVLGPWGLGPRVQGCASRARNTKGPKITPFWHQLGRHPAVLHDIKTRLRRISAQISPDRSHPLNLNFFFHNFGPNIA